MKSYVLIFLLSFSINIFGAYSSKISGTDAGDIIIDVYQEIILKSQEREEKLLAVIKEHREKISDLETESATLKSEMANLKTEASTLKTVAVNLKTETATLKKEVASLKIESSTLKAEVPNLKTELGKTNQKVLSLESKTRHMDSDGSNTYFENTNVHIRNGMNSTHKVNGLGNLIIGYNDDQFQIDKNIYRFDEWENSTGEVYAIDSRNISDATKGSHNLILGMANGYSSYAGIVSGVSNFVQSPGSNLISTVKKDNTLPWSLNLQENFADPILDTDLILIKAGTFQMGNTGVSAGQEREKPVHTVTLTQDFYMMKTPVTQLMWYKIMKNNPSHFKSAAHCPGEKITIGGIDLCPNNPVETISWNSSRNFISRLNQKSGTNKYRFCTEAEWEYAAKAGTMTDYSFGNDTSYLINYAWYNENAGGHTHPVAKKYPNSWGLYDMHGNVYEWVSDWFGNYSSSSQTDPEGPSSGTSRIRRGGYWGDSATSLRSAYRNYYSPGGAYSIIGLRLCRTL